LKIVSISGALSIVYFMIGLWLLDRAGHVERLLVATTGGEFALVVNKVLSQHFVAGKDMIASPNENVLKAVVAMNFVLSFSFTIIGIITWVYVPRPVVLHNDRRHRFNKFFDIFSTGISARDNSRSTSSD
jgi:hypothetical protein